MIVLKYFHERKASVRGEYDVPVIALPILDEEQAQLRAFECHVHLEIAALVLATGRGMAFIHCHDFLPGVLMPIAVVLPHPILCHADDMQGTTAYLAQFLYEVNAVEPAVSQKVRRAYPSLPLAAHHLQGHLRLFRVKLFLSLVARTVRITL